MCYVATRQEKASLFLFIKFTYIHAPDPRCRQGCAGSGVNLQVRLPSLPTGCAERRATQATDEPCVKRAERIPQRTNCAGHSYPHLDAVSTHALSLLCSRLVYESTRDGHVAGAEVRIRQHGREIMLRRARQKVAPEGRRGTSALN